MPIFQGFGRWGAIGANESFDPGDLPGELVLLLDMEGTNGGTAFTDSSPSAHTITALSTTTSTARFKEGSSSALFGTYLEAPDSEDWNFGTGPFTIGMWSYHTGSDDFLIGQRPTGTAEFWSLIMLSSGIEFQMYTAGNPSGFGLIGGSSLSNQWVHHAVSRNASGKIRLRQNGVMVASGTDASAQTNISATLRLGRGQWTGGTSYQMAGNIDLAFVAKGVDLFDTDSTITPPETVAQIMAFFP